jgi:DNA-binding NarL/FixJ family response regulator
MNINMLVAFNLVVVVVLLIIVVNLLLRVKRLEEKSTDLSGREVAAFVEQMREIMVESEFAADRLEASIREREGMLEDLASLVDEKVQKLNRLNAYEQEPTIENLPLGDSPKQNQVYRMLMQGKSKMEIASQLGITTAEVDILARFNRKG